MVIMYGTRTFLKVLGDFGHQETCQICGKMYARRYIRTRTWFHITYIPLIPCKTVYYKVCPICANAQEIHKRAVESMIAITANQKLAYYARHILAKKPKGIFATDRSYELWVKDLATGEEICIASDVDKDEVKNRKQALGLKNLEFITVE